MANLVKDVRDGTWYFGEITPFADSVELGITNTDVICIGQGFAKTCIPVGGGRCYENITTGEDAYSFMVHLIDLGIEPAGTIIVDCELPNPNQ